MKFRYYLAAILLLSTIVCIFGGCKSEPRQQHTKESSAETTVEASEEITTEETETAQAVSVEDAYRFDYTEPSDLSEYFKLSYAIPKIMIDSTEIDALNKQIYDYFYPDIQNAESLLKDNNLPLYGELTYEWYTNDDVLSLLIYTESTASDSSSWYVYNVSVSEKNIMDTQDILSAYGISKQDYREKAKQAMSSCYLDTAMGYYYSENGADEWFLKQLKKTESDSNINAAEPFINADGQLCIAADVYSLVGGDCYQHILNLETFVLSEYYGKDFEAEEQEKKGGNAPQIYSDFLNKKQYRSEVYGDLVNQYCLFDLDQDGNDELILSGNGIMGGVVYQIYTINTQKGELVLAGFGESISAIGYSVEFRTIFSSWRVMNNGDVIYSYSISRLDGLEMNYIALFYYETKSDSYSDEFGSTLSRSECEKYLEDTIAFEFTPL